VVRASSAPPGESNFQTVRVAIDIGSSRRELGHRRPSCGAAGVASPRQGEADRRRRAEAGGTSDEQAQPRARKHRVRAIATGLLVFLACVGLVASIIGIWGHRNLLATARFTGRVAPLSDDPAFDAALGNELTQLVTTAVDVRSYLEDALPDRARILAVPLTDAIEGFIRDRVDKFVSSDRFDDLFESAVRRAHEAALRVLRGERRRTGRSR
jgi:hypothetical protein